MSQSSPLDRAVGRTSASEAKGGAGAEPSEKDLHATPKTLWAAVLLMCFGASLMGLAIVLFNVNGPAAVASLVAGVVVGLIGAFVGLRKGIMSNVE